MKDKHPLNNYDIQNWQSKKINGYVQYKTKDERYYQKYRDKLLAKMRQHIKCDTCKCYTTKSNYYNHIKSKRHLNLLKTNSNYKYCKTCKIYIKGYKRHCETNKHQKCVNQKN